MVTIPIRNRMGKIEDRVQLSLAEASAAAGPPVSTLRKLGREGAYNPIIGWGRRWYISADDFLRLFNRRLHNQVTKTEEPL